MLPQIVQVASPNDRQSLRLVVIFGAIFFFLFFLIAYLSGGASILRRTIQAKICQFYRTMKCNSYLNIFKDEPIPDISSASLSLNYTANVVYITATDSNLWVWSPHWILKRYKLVDESTFGVSVFSRDSDKSLKKLKNYIDSGVLQITKVPLLDPSSQPLVDTLLVYSVDLNKEKFQKVVRPGNLLNIAYNTLSDDLIGVIVIDMDRI